ncbi:MAG: S26 family signal peptidase [Desulforegulaceae bacterium]|nr:S26 family signal peptidase [Desulforegulaceae bacterium]
MKVNIEKFNMKSVKAFFSERKKLFLMCLCVFFLSNFILSHIMIIFHDSINYNFAWIYKKNNILSSDIKKGEYAFFTVIHPFENKEVQLIKKVGCDENDFLTVNENKEYFCNDSFIGKAKDKAKNGETVKFFSFNGKIPEGHFFFVGSHPDSYDSRYYGFYKKEDILGLAHPLF